VSAAQQGAAELPQGMSHLLVASDALSAGHWEGSQVTVCGAVIEAAPAVEDPRYCPACVRAAMGWSRRARRSECLQNWARLGHRR
jgi:hypothetical protein